MKYSIEVFPPKNGGSLDSLLQTVDSLACRNPRPEFVSVTYGAMGNARGGTVELASMVKRHYNIETIAHITAVNKSRQEIENLLVGAEYARVNRILALRGDAQQGKKYRKYRDGHTYAYQLVEQIRDMNSGKYLHGEGKKTNFLIGVACYPEGHKDNPRKHLEAKYLKIKQDAGADFAVTQMVFDNDKYLGFVEQAKTLGVTIPILPGIMPIRSFDSVKYFEDTFGVSIPKELAEDLKRYENDKEAMEEAGLRHAAKQIQELTSKGVNAVHIYTMNRPEAAKKLIASIGDF